ncbi:SIMPL domain-containing protein [Candidatus Electronema sp. JM]|uniref:SIMPL domain-containing protein n=1 Tax=Candidatus Electronema sp. JM TaxID=3401571 RepID=UPI003AA7BFEB
MIALSLGMNAHAFEIPDFPFVYAQGEAEKKIPPDIATISFKVQQYDESAEKALDTVQKRCAELVVFLTEQQISKDDIVAYQIDKRAVREQKINSFNQLKILGYEATRSFSVKLKELSRYEQIIKKLLAFQNVIYVNTMFDRTDRKKIEADLIAEASSNAKSQAELMASGFGAEVESVFSVSQEDFRKISDAEFIVSSSNSLAAGYEGIKIGIGMSSAEFEKIKLQQQAGEFLFVPSVITLQKNIKVIFKLKTAPAK